MNLKSLFRPLAQSLLDSAMPEIRASLTSALAAAVAKDVRVPAELKLVVLSVAQTAIDAWTIKL